MATRRSARNATALAVLAIVVVLVASLVVVLVDRPRVVHGQAEPVSAGPLARPGCGYTRLLVPNCGRWWGMAPLAHTTTPVAQGLAQEESAIGRPLDILHVYHRNDELFPTASERRLALQHGRERLLLINWKPATDRTWRAVADGAADARIDTLAAHLKSTWRHRFFLDVWHEPENDVIATPGSGMTASDYAAMYRHVVLRLRADGVAWAVTVLNYIGFDKWAQQSWFPQLWPGDDVVDWIGIDPYGTGARTGYNARDFATLVNRPEGGFPGYYTWATKQHPGKPIMLAEWGVEASTSNPAGQASFFDDVGATLHNYPQVKALVYFDMPTPPPGQPRTYLRANALTLAAYQQLGREPVVVAPRVTYP